MEVNKKTKTITVSQNTGITVSITLIIMFAGALITGTTWLTDMRNRTSNLELAQTRHGDDINILKAESVNSQIKFTEIQTQLKAIEALLIELKDRRG